ncbi:MAG: murein biosynthesis integral membrane protein MurJ [Armatimonadota bacterium]|nr:murein biosynthesis integral membrane protein MurJ [Armatimonadota bacterium]
MKAPPQTEPDVTPFDKQLPPRPARSAPPPALRPLQAAVVLSALFLLARITGLAQQSIINALLPRHATDAYVAAFRLPDFINYLVAGGAMSITFIPIFTELVHSGRQREAWQFFSTLATLMGLALVALVGISVLAAEPLVHLLSPGLTDPHRPATTFPLAVAMTRIMLPAQIFFYLGGMIVGVLNAHRRFAASGWTGAVYNVVAIIVALCLFRFVGAVAFAWGILIGAFAGNFLLPLLAARSGPANQRLRYRIAFDWRNPAVRRFFLNALPIMLGVSLPVVDQIVVTRFASFLGEGPLTYLHTANRAMLAPLGIVAQAASVAAFPYLAADTAAQDWPKFAEFLRTGLRRLMFLTLPLSVLLILIAQPLIDLLFGYGQYDEPRALHQTAVAFAFYCVGLFAWTGQQFVARGFYALQDTRTPTIIGSVLTIFFFIPLVSAAAHLPAAWGGGVLGLAGATSIGATAHFCCILIALERKLRQRRYNVELGTPHIAGTLLRTVTACLPMGIAGLLANTAAIRFLADDKIGDVLRIIAVSLVASLAFALAAHLFRIPDWQWLRARVQKAKGW